MVALNALNTASTLLQQIVSNSKVSAANAPTSTSSIAQTASGVSTATGSAAKSVSSAIFNAVAATSEKQDETIKAVLEYIDRDYTKLEEKFPSLVSLAAEDPSIQGAIDRHKAVGEALKTQVQTDPSRVYKMMQQLKTSRPEISQEHAIGLMLVELGKRTSSQSTSAL